MTDWNREIAQSYDRVASAYATSFGEELARKPFDRELLDRFAADAADHGLIADVGSGPGHVASYLTDRGSNVIAIDLSHNMASVGRSRYPAVRFVVGDFFHLPVATDSLGGAIAFYSLIHSPRADVTHALREIKRVLRSGAGVLVAVHGGSGEIHADEFLGTKVAVDASYFQPEEIAGYLGDAGFEVEDVRSRIPYGFEFGTQRVYVRGRA
jgi:ubiquinone/menaquinone biosynthesis C-methylase UbiE